MENWSCMLILQCAFSIKYRTNSALAAKQSKESHVDLTKEKATSRPKCFGAGVPAHYCLLVGIVRIEREYGESTPIFLKNFNKYRMSCARLLARAEK